MKKLNFLDKIIYLFNCLAALVLLLAYLLPYVAPKQLSFVSVLSLSVPILLLVNVFFSLYWLLKVKRQMILSLVVLLLGFNNVSTLYKFSSSNSADFSNLSVMSYNVRLFNLYNWIDNPNIVNDIENFISKENADVVAIQEYHPNKEFKLLNYNNKFVSLSGKKSKYGLAIFSKYKIISKGEIKFNNSTNKAIFSDIVKGKDTLRIYNVHFESLHINPDLKHLSEQNKEYLVQRIGNRFKLQQEQAELILKHQKSCVYKKIILGDFNNTAYSYIYKQFTANDYNDTFELAGSGFGRTFNFNFFPLRIDFILSDKNIKVNDFISFSNKYSDHYPIMASFSI